MIRVQPSACFLIAALILLLPLDWLIAALLAAAVHELGHLAAIYAFGSCPERISIGGFGARIHTGPLDNRKEFFCAAAGPAASLFLLVLCRHFPKLAFCGMAQGMFNLIPVHPMDGGRMMHCVIRGLFPQRAERIFLVLQSLAFCGIVCLALMLTIQGRAGFLPVLVCITVLSRLIRSKIPCKSA